MEVAIHTASVSSVCLVIKISQLSPMIIAVIANAVIHVVIVQHVLVAKMIGSLLNIVPLVKNAKAVVNVNDVSHARKNRPQFAKLVIAAPAVVNVNLAENAITNMLTLT